MRPWRARAPHLVPDRGEHRLYVVLVGLPQPLALLEDDVAVEKVDRVLAAFIPTVSTTSSMILDSWTRWLRHGNASLR